MSRFNKSLIGIVGITVIISCFNNCSASLDTAALEAEMKQSSTGGTDPTTGAPIDTGTGTVNPTPTSAAPVMSATVFQVASGQTLSLSVTGGEPPLTYSVTPSTGGSINASTKTFTANQPGVTSLKVTDSAGRSSEIAVTVGSTNGGTPGASCVSPWGSTVPNGASIRAYSTSQSVKLANGIRQCTSQLRKCTDGILSGTYRFPSCKL